MDVETLFSVEGKVAVVTGGSPGLGCTLASGLAHAGAAVAIFARDEASVQTTAQEIEQASGGPVLAVAGDIAIEEDVQRLYESVHTRFGPVDIIVANAAAINRPHESTWEISLSTWHRTVEVTLTGTFLTCKLAAAEMIDRRSGKIICIASTSSVVASPGHAPYIAAKGGVLQFVRALALETAPFGVNVNAIGPALINTEMSRATFQDSDRRAATVSRLPLGRALEPEDLLGTCLFLASRTSDMVTGQMLLVDAGLTIH